MRIYVYLCQKLATCTCTVFASNLLLRGKLRVPDRVNCFENRPHVVSGVLIDGSPPPRGYERAMKGIVCLLANTCYLLAESDPLAVVSAYV